MRIAAAFGGVGTALAPVFGLVARLRSARGLHPDGRVMTGTLRREGLAATGSRCGVPWLDEPGEDPVLVRFSRGGGLPRALPDMLGLAVRVPDAGLGDPADLLLTTGGRSRLGRHLPSLHRDPRRGGYTSLISFRTPAGPLMIGGFPDGDGVSLEAATPFGRWRPFARLEVGEPAIEGPDDPIGFDPMRHGVPGLRMPEPLRRLREPSYQASRRARGSRQ